MKRIRIYNKAFICRCHNNNNFVPWSELIFDNYIIFANHKVFEFVDSIEDSDIIIVDDLDLTLRECSEDIDNVNKIIAAIKSEILDLQPNIIFILPVQCFHLQEEYPATASVYTESYLFCEIKKLVAHVINLHTNAGHKNYYGNCDWCYTDFLFNRTYALHFDFERLEKIYDTATKNHWYHDSYDPEIYALSSTDKVFDIASTTVEHLHNINKDHSIPIYVAPNNTRSESLKFLNSELHKDLHPQKRSVYRFELKKLVSNYKGYIGDISMGNILFGNTSGIDGFDITGNNGWGYTPPHNAYYDSSSVSFFIETLTYINRHCQVMCATEKTWTPILKCHFILPYGPQNYIRFLKNNYNIKFPDFIDVSWDDVLCNNTRYNLYLNEVKRLCDMGGRELMIKKIENKDLLIHNRNQIKDHGYKDPVDNYIIDIVKNIRSVSA